MRDRFADRLAFKAGDGRSRRAEIRRRPFRSSRPRKREVPSFGQVTKAEKGLIWLAGHEPAAGLAPLRAWKRTILRAGARRCWISRGN
jgi:hypothetical protein